MTVNTELSDAVYRATREPGSDLTTTIIEGLATLEGTTPLELDVRLAERIDPDALEDLFEPSPKDVGYLVFPLEGYLVSVHSNGDVAFHRD